MGGTFGCRWEKAEGVGRRGGAWAGQEGLLEAWEGDLCKKRKQARRCSN